MFDSAFFNPGRPLARCAIRFLYCVALVMIALILIRGVIGGVRVMAGPPVQSAGMGAPMTPGALPAEPRQPGAVPPRFARPGMMRPPFMRPGPRRGFLGAGPLLRGLPAPVLGVILILFALLRAAVMWAVIRVLAEIALVLLDLRKAFPAASGP